MSDFFNTITQFISGATDKVGRKTDELLAVQGLKGQIRTAQREVDKHYTELGKIIYAKFSEGAELDEDMKPYCEDIARLAALIEQYKEDIDLYREKSEEEVFGDDELEETFCAGELVEEACDKAEEAVREACEVVEEAEEAAAAAADDIEAEIEELQAAAEAVTADDIEAEIEELQAAAEAVTADDIEAEIEELQAAAEAAVEE